MWVEILGIFFKFMYAIYLNLPSFSFFTSILFVHSYRGSRILKEEAVDQFHGIEQNVVIPNLHSSRRATLGSIPYTQLYFRVSKFPKHWEGPQAERPIAPAY